MAHTTIRITQELHALLKRIAAAEDRSMQSPLERAMEEYRRREFEDDFDAAYSRLRRDEQGWTEFRKELSAWDSTSMDGLVVRESPAKPGKGKRRRKKGRR